MKPTFRRMTVVTLLSFGLSALLAPAGYAADSAPSKQKKSIRKKPVDRGFLIGPKRTTYYEVDTDSSRNQVTFTSKAPKETIVGTTKTITGHFDLKPRKLAKAKGRFAVAWKSLDTGNSMKNQHMQAAPWVDAAQYPDIVFTLSGIEKIKSKGKSGKSVKVQLIGTMAINGAEKEMQVPATLVYVKPKKTDKGEKLTEGIGIRCAFTVALADFNIKGRGVGQAVSPEQKIKVALFLKRSEKPKDDGKEDKPSDAKS